MATVEVITTTLNEETNLQYAQLEVTEGGVTYAWGRGGIDGNLTRAEVETFVNAEADKLWQAASAKSKPVNAWQQIETKKLLEAFAEVMLDEINTIRTNPALGLAPRTKAQVVSAIKSKLQA